MSILSLKETTSSFFEDLSDLTTDIFAGNGPPYPEFIPLTPKLERGKAFKVFPYSFRVADSGALGNLPFIGSDFVGIGEGGGPGAPFRELKLNLNPQSINLDETYAINLTPTEGGIVREHQGLIFRDLTITGTTGINPNRGTQGLIEGVESGYEGMHRLINFMRSYGEKMKIDSQFRGSKQLVFVNRKDSEELVVEPVRITRKKAVPRSTLYEYTMVFKVIGPLKQTFPFPEWMQGILNGLEWFGNIVNDVYFRFQAARGILVTSENFLTNVQADIVNAILEPLRQVSSFLQSYGNFQQTLLDLPSNIYNDIKSEGGAQIEIIKSTAFGISHPTKTKYKNTDTQKKQDKGKVQLPATDNLGSFMEEEGISVENASSVPVEQILTPAQQQIMLEDLQANSRIQKDQIDELIKNLEDLSLKVAQQSNLSDSDFENFIEEDIVSVEVSATKLPTDQEIDVLQSLEEIKTSLQYLQTAVELYAEDPTEKEQQAEDAFGGNIDVQQASSVRTIVLDKGQTVVDLATTYLGDVLRWIDIVHLNNLKPPFTTEDLDSILVGVKKPGDTILIPLNTPTAIPNNQPVEQRPINANLNALERNLGIDIKLTGSGDYAFSNNDIQLVAGVPNALQALKNAFQTTPGELRHHPSYGFQLRVGEKITSITATDVFDAAFNTVLSDNRFEDIKNLQINFNNSIITTIMKVAPKGGALPVPLVLRF